MNKFNLNLIDNKNEMNCWEWGLRNEEKEEEKWGIRDKDWGIKNEE